MGRRKEIMPPFTAVYLDLLRDPIWRKLSNSAKVTYIHLRAKFNHETLSIVTLTYSEMKDMMSSKTLSKAFKELMKNKLIEKVRYGGLYGRACRYKFLGEYKYFYYQGHKV